MLTIEDFIQMEKIDHQYFLDENVSPAEEVYKWYIADPNSCVVVKIKSKVVAFVNILSLKKDVFNKVKHNKMNESEIVVEDLELDRDKYFNYLYFSSIAIDKNHRDIKILRKLIAKTTQKIIEIVNKNCEIKEVMADCSTPEGEKITQRFLKLKPFKKTSHGSIIHILGGKDFLKYVYDHAGQCKGH